MHYEVALRTLNAYVGGTQSAERDKDFIAQVKPLMEAATMEDYYGGSITVAVYAKDGKYIIVRHGSEDHDVLRATHGATLVTRRLYLDIDSRDKWTAKEFAAYFRKVAPEWVTVRRARNAVKFTTNRSPIIQKVLANKIGRLGVQVMQRDWMDEMSPSFYDAYRLENELLKLNSRDYVLKEARATMKLDRPEAEVRVTKPVRSGGGDFEKFRDGIKASRKTDERIIEKFPVAPHGVVSSLSWGIEVESGGARGAVTPAGWDAKGDGSLYSAYGDDYHDDDCEAYDDDDYDCTCAAGGNDCREFVSPILHSFHSQGLEALVTHLSTQPQNDSSGVHVHVGVDDMTAKQIGSLVYGYNIIEPMLEASYRRNEREYCKERNSYELRQILSDAKRVKLPTQIGYGDRYVTLNLMSLHSHKTVEFRAMGPVYEYEYLIKWAHFCREMVNVARAGVSQKEWNQIDSFDKLQALFIAKGKESFGPSLEITQDDIDKMVARNGYNRANAELVKGEV